MGMNMASTVSKYYSDNLDGDNDLCDKVISNIFNHQLLKECGITRHSDAKINLTKKNKKSLDYDALAC